jgi:NAD(P)-dependent dehydrogenase (short-subunit alcohol dehydrogenase family)
VSGPERRNTTEVLEGIDLHGEVIVITGGSTGIGFETARALGAAGASIMITARTEEKGEDAVARLRDLVPGGEFDYEVLELGSLDSVRACAADLRRRCPRIDVLICNAGIMAVPFGRTAEGFELQFGTNHLGHFVLVGRLLPSLLLASPSRIVLLSSAGHGMSDVIWDDPNFLTTEYSKMEAYGQSKTANILHAVELERRYGPQGIHAYAVHPGMVATELGRHFTAEDFADIAARAAAAAKASTSTKKSAASKGSGGGLDLVTPEVGASTSVWAATASELEGVGGLYLADRAVTSAAPYAVDADAAMRLWALSEELVGETFS